MTSNDIRLKRAQKVKKPTKIKIETKFNFVKKAFQLELPIYLKPVG
jgi:hypothetical protein